MFEQVSRLKEQISCTIQTLTPIHIGAGQKLLKDFDFITSGNRTTIIPQEVLFNYLRKHEDQLQRVVQGEAPPMQVLRAIEQDLGTRNYETECTAQDLLTFIRTGLGTPYLPGSSVKGAIRTAFVHHYWNQLSEAAQQTLLGKVKQIGRVKHNRRKEWAAEPIVEHLLGKTPNENWGRFLQVSDAHFEQQDMELNHVRVISLSDRNQQGWYYKSYDIFAEMLQWEITSEISISLDQFLSTHTLVSKSLRQKGLSWEQLCMVCNDYAKTKLEDEADWMDMQGLEEPKGSIEELLDFIPKNHDGFLLRLGWGSGWVHMTGDYLNDDDLDEMRTIFRLSKYTPNQVPLFPKSRRIIMDGKGPWNVTGWVLITRK